ncbi:M20 family metallopeptidase [Lihuaxuella thermophila]|uniref:Glutamate carboxypeptidase n=1 Tax=Lihuaxuella thermophila TaxID=1173111 RepID=A0A1H8AVR5_9BACL|nr:M20 family metallopeptidase [Lihuaxuella thermophila]SEM73888.1 glutamate carboxypeptidase [Lihuaxuella thermophila]
MKNHEKPPLFSPSQIRTVAAEATVGWENRLRALVEVDCGTRNPAGVKRVGDIFAGWMSAIGFQVDHLPVEGCAGLWVGRMFGKGRKRIGLLGHADTVYPDGTAESRPMKRQEQLLLGPGVSDMKGGLLVGLYAVEVLRKLGWEDFSEICFVLNSEEETGSFHTRNRMAEQLSGMDAVYVLEAARANGNIVSSRAGVAQLTLTACGRSAHAGVEPEKGANAIVALLDLLQWLRQRTTGEDAYRINIGTIQGGTASNVVPDRAVAQVDIRLFHHDAVDRVDRLAKEAASRPTTPGVTITADLKLWFPPMFYNQEIGRLAALAVECADSLGMSLGHTGTGGGSDANWIAAQGVPCLDGLGPVGGLDHSPDEYIEPDSFVPRTALLALLMTCTPLCKQSQ